MVDRGWADPPDGAARRYPLAVLVVMTVTSIVTGHYGVSDANWSPNAWWLALFGAGACP